ncbi:TPA: hypothetical protein HA278_03100 [Candidatus Woesearchaeota archaeon]|nr:hypothetical protein [archaeon]HIJ11022.1 hypothetical protein [Candidatus Woesearchaeota archaeon]|tara:strand:+ start:23 stop:724 length:702 start_codon:yes stop_codon:yes gene_type:complete
MRKLIIPIAMLLCVQLALAAPLHGTIYNTDLNIAGDVLVEVDGQKYLSKDGQYTFDVTEGMHTITATKGLLTVVEDVSVKGDTVFDIFLLGDFSEEDELWHDTDEEYFPKEEEPVSERKWAYWVAGIVFLFTLFRIYRARKKYGPLKVFRKRVKAESMKSVEEHKKDLEQEPGHIEKALEIMRKHDGRISQKQLRKEMLYLSEAKVSLIVTELEHIGKVEKVKKGRGNVILLK